MNNYRSQKTESKYNQNEESTEHLDSIANSIAINSTEVQNCWGDVKTAISDLVKNKNDEIQQVKKFSDEENKWISKNTELFNSTIDSTKTYLKLIDQIANNIKSKVKGNTKICFIYHSIVFKAIKNCYNYLILPSY